MRLFGICTLKAGSTATCADLTDALQVFAIPPYPRPRVSVPILILALAVFWLSLIFFAQLIIILLEQFSSSLAQCNTEVQCQMNVGITARDRMKHEEKGWMGLHQLAI